MESDRFWEDVGHLVSSSIMNLLFGLIIAVFAVVLVLTHLYLWRRFGRDVFRSRSARRAMAGVMTGLGLLLLASMLPRWSPRSDVGGIAFAGLVWLGMLFYLLVVMGLIDLGRLLQWLIKKARARSAPTDPERRLFLSRALAGGGLTAVSGLTGWGIFQARHEFHTPEIPVILNRLPRSLSGFRLVVLSDLHLGPTLGADFTRRVVAQANALRPDAVAIVGDLIDGPVRFVGPDVRPLADLKARHGVYFSTGNHEYFNDLDDWLPFIRRLGIRTLCNERVRLVEENGAGFWLAGVNDWAASRFRPEQAPDIERALAGVTADEEVVLMAHQPKQVADAAAHGVGLQISGHTHGGQLWPFGLLTRIVQPYLSGLHQHTAETQIYVSSGTGYWGPPMRILAPAEIACLVLEPA
jgi:predicted MPP superfamily phosphohydrolase